MIIQIDEELAINTDYVISIGCPDLQDYKTYIKLRDGDGYTMEYTNLSVTEVVAKWKGG